MPQETILIAFGGASPEHEVSVLSAVQAMEALKETQYRCLPLYISKTGKWYTGAQLKELENYKDLKKLESELLPCTFSFDEYGNPALLETSFGLFRKPKLHRVDCALMAFHGADGENGSFQGACEVFNVPYTGASVTGSAVGMDKRISKDICRSHDIPVTDDIWFSEKEWVAGKTDIIQKASKLGFPLFVKPVHLGSSIGVKKINSAEALEQAIEFGFRYDDILIVEKGVQPLTEINCSVLGDYDEHQPSVCEQPLGKEELLSFEDKYMSDGGGKGMASASRKIPAPLSEKLTNDIQNAAVKIFKILNCRGVARLDFLVNSDTNEFYFNEINTIPGSFSFYLWEATDLPFPKLLEKLIVIAMKAHREKNGRVRSHETNLLSEKAVKGIKGLKGGNK